MKLAHEVAADPLPLRVVQQLLDRLHDERVPYCHWKSNEHLEAAVRGVTDLDVLVSRASVQTVAVILAEFGYKRFAAVPGRAYVGIEDYLGLDAPTGRLVHLHLHYQLTLGERNLKGYRLPWEDLLLSRRVLDPGTGVFTSDPHCELILLVVRTALKLSARDVLLSARAGSAFRGSVLAELSWLRQRVGRDEVLRLASTLLGRPAVEPLAQILDGDLTLRRLLAFRRAMLPAVRLHRTYGPAEARALALLRAAGTQLRQVLARVLPGYLPTRRILPQGGVTIAFIGSDGSGKSTLTTEVARWLGWKVDVALIYFGSGGGPASLTRRALQSLSLPRRGSDPDRRTEPPAGPKGRPASLLLSGLRTVRSTLVRLALAREKRLRLRRARSARNRGAVVVCDRYPQHQIMGSNDGPLLSHWSGHRAWPLRALARLEANVYRSAENSAPDLVLRLNVSPEAAWARKRDMPLETVRPRVEAVRSLRYREVTRVVEIDAEQPFEQVLRQVKQEIWEFL